MRALPVPGAIGLAVRMAPGVRTALAARMAPVVRMPPVVLVGSSAGLPVVGLIPLVVQLGAAGWTAVAAGGAATAPQGGTCSVGRGPWPGAGW